MRRLFVPRARMGEGRAELTRADTHYLCDVLRLLPGDALEVFDGEGGLYPARLLAGGALVLGECRQVETSRRRLALAFALTRGEKCDLVVQKATELGAARLSPFFASRSVVHLDKASSERRVLRWARIAAQAARQCGRADVPRVDAPVPLSAVFPQAADGTRTILCYEGGGEPLGAVVDRSAPGHLVVVGPEGGFTDQELGIALAQGVRLASLGPRVLRFETACIAALAIVQQLAGDLA
ncbi:MAG TPA: 16S rRNA (uracil(1498)-N(3))-methyltransferase [Anaeromyxobacteraceae bacterium]|nr:16S rRNA (uracil(1498)-N(3))-methyltransferase [Anaeromyxobacteraceae bacterium]